MGWNRFATELLGPAVRASIPPGSSTTSRTVEYEAVEEFLAGAADTP